MHSSALFYSNRIEKLADLLLARLYPPGCKAFEKRIVIVPNEPVKDWLFHYFASHPQIAIAAGLQVFSLSNSFSELLSILRNDPSKRIPSFLELSLQLEETILVLMKDTVTDEPLRPLFEYLGSEYKRRLSPLCDQLSRLFNRYGLHGDEFLAEWLKIQGWQQLLWKKIFAPSTPWTYPIEALSASFSCSFQVHLFGFDYLPQIYSSFFQQLNAQFYHFSPCALFWEDLASDKERIYLERKLSRLGAKESQKQELRNYLTDRHPLLANWGKLGREYLKQLDLGHMLSEEEYVEPLQTCLLSCLQKDLLEMSEEKVPQQQMDRSIQLHSASSKWREVEILYNGLCSILEEPITPREILILAPDINDYAPFIHMVFGSSQSVLPYRMYGLQNQEQSESIQAFLHLLCLPKERFSQEAVLKLFSFTPFIKKMGFKVEEIGQIRRWIKQAGIRWGWNAQERHQYFLGTGQKSGLEDVSASGSWEQGLDRLVWGLAMSATEDNIDAPIYPCSSVDLSSIDLLEKWIGLMSSLREDLKPFMHASQMSLKGWLTHLLKIKKRYLPEDEGQSFFAEIRSLCEGLSHLEEECFSYASIERVLQHLGKQSRGVYSLGDLESVTFASISSGLMQSAKVVWILGMDEGSFPRLDRKLSLCEMSTSKGGKYILKHADEDRFAFLQQLCLAEEYFIMSYQRIHPEDNKEQGPSLIVQELLQHLPGVCSVDHPELPFDESYFSLDAPFKSYSESHFLAAVAARAPQESMPLFEGKTKTAGDSSQQIVVDLKKLMDLARHPIRFYFHNTLQIYLREEEDEEKEEFLLSPILKASLRKKRFKESVDSQIKLLDAQGLFPTGVFGSIAKLQLEEEARDFKACLAPFNIDPSDISSVELSLSCHTPHLENSSYLIFPALKIPLENGREALITGKFSDVSSSGLLFSGEDKLSDWIKAWPLYLTYLATFKEDKPLIFTKDGKTKNLSSESAVPLLSLYIAYYEKAKKEMSPLMPDWSSAIFKESEEDLAKKMNASLDQSSFDDEYLLFLKRRSALPIPSLATHHWAPVLQHVFAPLLSLWQKAGKNAEV